MPPGDRELYENLHGSIYLHAPESITHLAEVDPTNIGKTALARKHLPGYPDTAGRSRHVQLDPVHLSDPGAGQACELSQEAYTRQIISACFLNRTDPVARWNEIFKNAGRIKRWLSKMDVRHYHVTSANIDLEVSRVSSGSGSAFQDTISPVSNCLYPRIGAAPAAPIMRISPLSETVTT